MKFIAAGCVHPARASVTIPIRQWQQGALIAEFWCVNSQFHLVLIHDEIQELELAALVAEHVAQTLIDAAGFRLGACYRAEVIQVLAENGAWVVPGVLDEQLAFSDPEVEQIVGNAVKRDIHLRFAVRDYLAAIVDHVDCMYLCARAVESIAKSFSPPGYQGNTRWELMHDALDVDSDARRRLARWANPTRHGNWSEASIPSEEQRQAGLALARHVILLYIAFLAGKPEQNEEDDSVQPD